ncbi:MAG: hypothetical protein JSC188_000890 [Candidatus Tokpelaia sp. JSC188]|nr:MAG: hypothetical protein JSC188_000890 [Candidatus Tokpelaia sp. JSC188]
MSSNKAPLQNKKSYTPFTRTIVDDPGQVAIMWRSVIFQEIIFVYFNGLGNNLKRIHELMFGYSKIEKTEGSILSI